MWPEHGRTVVGIRLDGYIRVSQVGGRSGESFISPAVQRQQIERWAELRGVEIAEWHVDLNQSGVRFDRPGLMLALERIEAGMTGGLVVAKLDRFARSVAESAQTIQRIERSGGVLASVAENIDPTTPFGKFALTVMLAMGELERTRLIELREEARTRRISRGWHMGEPLGYTRPPAGPLAPNQHADVVRELFRRRGQGQTLHSLARWLDSQVAPRQARHWSVRTVSHVLENRVYLGEAFCAHRRATGAHPALITEQEYAAANRKRGQRPTPAHTDEYLLGGLVRCEACGYRARTDFHQGVPMYRCPKHHGCAAPFAIRAERLESYVVASFLDRLATRDYGPTSTSPATLAAEQLVKERRRELRAYRDAPQIRDLLADDLFLEGLRARRDALRAAEQHLDVARRRSAGVEVQPKQDWANVPLERRRSTLRHLIDGVLVRPGNPGPGKHRVEARTTILWRDQAPELRQRRRPGRYGAGVPS